MAFPSIFLDELLVHHRLPLAGVRGKLVPKLMVTTESGISEWENPFHDSDSDEGAEAMMEPGFSEGLGPMCWTPFGQGIIFKQRSCIEVYQLFATEATSGGLPKRKRPETSEAETSRRVVVNFARVSSAL